MAQKLYVGQLPYETTDQELQELFASAGTVTSATVITDRMSGRSKGFGFVEMSTEEEAQNAISTLNGKEVGGRTIIVNEARPQEPRPDRGNYDRNSGGRGGYGGGYNKKNW